MKTLKKYDIVRLYGEPCQLTETPERVSEDTWTLVFRTRVGSPSVRAYANDAFIAELAATLRS